MSIRSDQHKMLSFTGVVMSKHDWQEALPWNRTPAAMDMENEIGVYMQHLKAVSVLPGSGKWVNRCSQELDSCSSIRLDTRSESKGPIQIFPRGKLPYRLPL